MKNNQESQNEYIKMLEDIINGSLTTTVNCREVTEKEKENRVFHTNVEIDYDLNDIKEKIENMFTIDRIKYGKEKPNTEDCYFDEDLEEWVENDVGLKKRMFDTVCK